jgi:hypothetical protein
MVVGVPAEDVEVGAAETDGRHAHAYIVAAGRDDRNVAKLDLAHVSEYGGAH